MKWIYFLSFGLDGEKEEEARVREYVLWVGAMLMAGTTAAATTAMAVAVSYRKRQPSQAII